MWPTPAANDDNKSPEAHLAMKRRMGERDGTYANRMAVTSLQVLAQMWPTASANEDAAGRPGAKMQQMLKQQVETFSLPAPETPPDGQPSSPETPGSPRRSLNPRFVEWLQGWEPGWTSVAPTASGSRATASYLWRQRMRSELSRLGWE